MTRITIYSEDRRFIDRVIGVGLFIKIIDGIQCICEDTSETHFDDYNIIYTIPRNFFVIIEDENND